MFHQTQGFADDEHDLVDKGYARSLTKDETLAILDEYVAYAEKVFSEKPVVITQKKDKKQSKKTYEMKGLFEDERTSIVNGR